MYIPLDQKMYIEVFIIGGSHEEPIKRRSLGRYAIPHDYTFDRFLVRMQQKTGCSTETLLIYRPSAFGKDELRPVQLTDTPRSLGMLRPTRLDEPTVPEILLRPLLKNSPPTKTPYHMNEPSDDQ